jgi:predicted DNA-binding protein (MmcQ/YjbR family)
MVSEDDILAYVAKLDDVSEREVAPDEKRKIFCRGERIFCVMSVGMAPVRLDLRCDSKLARTLEERYESVMQSRVLGRGGIEILCTGQLELGDVLDLIRHSYEISTEE